MRAEQALDRAVDMRVCCEGFWPEQETGLETVALYDRVLSP